MAKKKNSRKVLAVALGIMGIAGLSLASASQLNITATQNIAVGTGSFTAACDTAVDVSYTYSIATGKYTNLVIAGIDPSCVNKSLTYTLKDNTLVTPVVLKTATITPLTAATSVTIDISSINLTTGLGAVDIAIF
jgi:hypothetical protein